MLKPLYNNTVGQQVKVVEVSLFIVLVRFIGGSGRLSSHIWLQPLARKRQFILSEWLS